MATFCAFLLLTEALTPATGAAATPPQHSLEAPREDLGVRLTESWRWVRFTTAAGLPSNSVIDVAETPEGTIWAATSRGLAWFDDYEWYPVEAEDGLPTEGPLAIAVHGTDDVLVVLHAKLFRGNRRGFREIRVYESETQEVIDVVALGGGRSVIMAAADPLAPVVPFLYENDRFEPLPDHPPTYWDHAAGHAWGHGAGSFWLNTVDGLHRWDGSWSKWIPSDIGFPLGVELVAETEGRNGLASVNYPDERRGVWEWTDGGEPRITGEPTDLLQSMDISPRGDAVAVYRSGDVRVRVDGRWSRLEITPPQMAGLLRVRFRSNGDLWVGTQRGLFLMRASLRRWTHWGVESPNVQNEILDILRARDGSIWLATGRGVAVHRPDGAVEWITRVADVDLREVTGLAEDADGGIWISSGSALSGSYRFDGVSWRHYGAEQGLDAPLVHRIRKDLSGRLWFLGMKTLVGAGPYVDQPGAFLYEDDRFEPWGPEQGLGNGRVYDFTEGPAGTYWFATLGGLSRWRDGSWKHWTVDDGLIRNRIFTLAVGAGDRLWFADQVSGLGFIDDDDRPRYITAADGLINDEVQELRAGPGGELWISTRGGLACYHMGNWLNLDLNTGLSSPNLWPILPVEDRVYVGTSGNGVDVLDLHEKTYPQPRVTAQRPIVNEESALLRWKAASYWGQIPAENIETRYRLDGGAWSEWSTVAEALIPDLAPGDHDFDIQAKGMFGGFDAPALTVPFTIAPPFYRRANFYLPVGTLTGVVLLLLAGRRRHVALLRERDADQRRRLEERVAERTEALRDSEERLRLLLETTHVFPYEADAGSSRFTYAGPQAVRILGYPVERWYQPGFWRDQIHPDDVDEAVAFSAEKLETEEQFEADYRMIAADGEVVWIHDIVSVIRQPKPDGTTGTILRGFMIDVTARKRAEEERLRAESEAHEHRERLAHIARVNMLGEMATGIAHEVNQPLTAVSTYTQACKRLLAAGSMDHEQLLDVLGRISDEAVRAGDVIHGLKTLVRRRDSELRICNVNDLVHEVLTLAEVESRDRGVDIVLDLDHSIGNVAADDVQIQQVLLNLIRNAVEATDAGGGAVTICTTEAAGVVRVEVADRGPGLDDNDPDRVFQPFFSTKAEGMGMGLSISRSIIAAHGGHIGHRPRAGGGSVFFFHLPTERRAAATG